MSGSAAPELKGVSSVEAAATGPVSVDFDSTRAKKCASALLLPTEAEKDFLSDMQATPATQDVQPPLRRIFLTWTCFEKFGEEQYIRTRNIRLYHSAYKGMKSVLIAGGPVHRYQKKNKKREVIDAVVSVRTLKHSNLDVQQKKLESFVKEYGLIISDNRCIRELPPFMRSKVAVKLDCTDMKKFTQRVDWALKSASIKTGKGNLSIRIGTTLLSSTELLENARFVLRFMEDHIPEIWANLKTASLMSPGHPTLKILDKTSALPGAVSVAPVVSTGKRKRGEGGITDADRVAAAEAAPLQERGVDIFALKRRKAVKAGKAGPVGTAGLVKKVKSAVKRKTSASSKKISRLKK